MKKLIILSSFLLFSAFVFSQAPNKFSYQSVIRDVSGALVQNHAVGMKISVLKGSAPVYVETHTATTNANGLVSVEVGGGSAVSGVFANIDWSDGTYNLKTETDPSGGTSYSITGTTQLVSVPYALHAEEAVSLVTKQMSLNIFGANLGTNATFEDGYGANSGIFMPKTAISSFQMNFTIPDNYISGDTIWIRMVVSATATGVVRLLPNAITIASPVNGFIQSGGAANGLFMETVDIAAAGQPEEIWGFIVSPGVDMSPGDAIVFNYYRSATSGSDTNTGIFKIHGMEIYY